MRDHQQRHVDDRNLVGSAQFTRACREADLDGVVIVEDEIGDAYEVSAGLAAGDQVVSEGALFLQFAESQ